MQSSYDIQKSPFRLHRLLQILCHWIAFVFGEGIFIMKLIPLSKRGKNKGKYFAMVDDEDFDYLNKTNWSLTNKKSKLSEFHYAWSGNRILMHRIILGVVGVGICVDHVDGNGLNNQRSNLRICTHAQNMANKKSKKNGTSKYLGVHKTPSYGKWQAKIKHDKKRIYLGSFKNEIEAALAYNEAAIKIHGEFAKLNIITP